MEYIVEKIGMSRTLTTPSSPVTLLKVVEAKVCEVKGEKALIAYSCGKNMNKAIAGAQKKYNLSTEFNKFATVEAQNAQEGDQSTAELGETAKVKATFKTKGRGFSGVMKRWDFAGGPGAHGSRFHRRPGSIGNREWPGRVQRGKKMAGRYGFDQVTVKNDVVSFDAQSNILVVKGSIPGPNGAMGKVRTVK